MNLVVVIRFKNNLDKAPIETGSRRYLIKRIKYLGLFMI
jgi:hypothetical protein